MPCPQSKSYASARSSAAGGQLDVERQTTILLIGAVIWAYLGIVFEILAVVRAGERYAKRHGKLKRSG